ncbi:MAG: ABC transporter ATP-binding protein [Paracoccaceae bacterium]|nr:ABC transporter ATP-binding protein [Paracoccaceae bacterium]
MRDVAFSWRGRTPFRIDVAGLTVDSGERIALLGESGSGKSTLLSLISGIMAPDHGSIRVAGTEISALRRSARDRFRAEQIGVIFQQFNLLPFATPMDNLLLPLRFAKARRARLDDPREEALKLTDALGLPNALVLRARASELSVGQQQRVAVARALLGAPALILADEPTSSLDAGTQDRFLDLLFEQANAANATLIMVTHDERLTGQFDRALRLGDVATISREAAA